MAVTPSNLTRKRGVNSEEYGYLFKAFLADRSKEIAGCLPLAAPLASQRRQKKGLGAPALRAPAAGALVPGEERPWVPEAWSRAARPRRWSALDKRGTLQAAQTAHHSIQRLAVSCN